MLKKVKLATFRDEDMDTSSGTKKSKKEEEEEEISSDEEEIEFIPEGPPLRFKNESSADVNHQYFMRSWCRTWARRKKVRLASKICPLPTPLLSGGCSYCCQF